MRQMNVHAIFIWSVARFRDISSRVRLERLCIALKAPTTPTASVMFKIALVFIENFSYKPINYLLMIYISDQAT